ncbi:hypothetical protein Golob_011638, partial [Gossypium lobatum]|nr:hypothetical protein [Gossypium lobatum]
MASEQPMIFIGRVMKKSRQREEEPPHEGGGSKSVGVGTSKEDDVRKDRVDDLLSIEFLNRTDALIEESMSTTIVVKLLGRRISYNALWNKCGRFNHLKEGCPIVNKEDAMEGDEIHHQGKSIETQQNGVMDVHERARRGTVDLKENQENNGSRSRFNALSKFEESEDVIQAPSMELFLFSKQQDKSIGMEDINSRNGNGKQISVSKECSRGKTQVEVNEIKGSKRKGQKFITKHPSNQVSIEISIPVEHAIQGMVSRLESNEQSMEALNGDGQIGEADTVGMEYLRDFDPDIVQVYTLDQ